jgi:hypothetical protein
MDFSNKSILERRMAALKTVKDEMSMGRRDYIFKEKVTNYKPYDGENNIRILPPTWEDAMHWGLAIYTHYKIGINQSNYLCLEMMLGKPCPVCIAQRKEPAKSEASNNLKAKLSMAAYLIDRKNKGNGPSIWLMPHKQIAEPIVIMSDRYTGEYKLIDHPEMGRDILFNKSGKELLTRYTAVQMLDPSPLSSDKLEAKQWLDYITAKPLKSLLQYRSFDHIEKALHGIESPDNDSNDVQANSNLSSSIEEPDVDFDQPSTPEPTSTNQRLKSLIKNMNMEQMLNYVKEENILLDVTMFDSDDELRDALMTELGIE